MTLSMQFSKILSIKLETFYWLFMGFILINMSLFTTNYSHALYQIPLLIYFVLVLAFRNSVPQMKTPLFVNIEKGILITILIYILLLVLPVELISASSSFVFPSALFAWLYFLAVGFSETIIWTIGLTNRIGIFWSSIFFALFHAVTNILLSGGTKLIPILALMGTQFLANIAYYYVLKYTDNALVVSIAHAMVDLAKVGYL